MTRFRDWPGIGGLLPWIDPKTIWSPTTVDSHQKSGDRIRALPTAGVLPSDPVPHDEADKLSERYTPFRR